MRQLQHDAGALILLDEIGFVGHRTVCCDPLTGKRAERELCPFHQCECDIGVPGGLVGQRQRRTSPCDLCPLTRFQNGQPLSHNIDETRVEVQTTRDICKVIRMGGNENPCPAWLGCPDVLKPGHTRTYRLAAASNACAAGNNAPESSASQPL